MPRSLWLIGLSAALMQPATIAQQQLLLVPAQYATIAQALSAARSGDTIAVAAGTYKENLVWPARQSIRLTSIAGPAVTIIDGSGTGCVINFLSASSITRSTIIEGFTIQGGMMNTIRNYGAGIYIDSGSPTIRGNVIRNNISDGLYYNHGGAIYVSNGSPLIQGNTIEGNECRNGSWNYGAGLYVTGKGKVDLIGNLIRGNRCVGGHRGNGVGVYIDSWMSALVTGNLVAGNTATSQFYNYGSGIHVSDNRSFSRSVDIVNNTFVDNVILATARPYGTLYLSGSSLRLYNNIIANNVPAGIYFNTLNTTVAADFNCVWNNGTNYTNTVASANDLSTDPLFVSATDRHLTPSSPCVDSGSNKGVPTTVAIDVDADPRRSDGNLDGSVGNGARVDIGADEYCVSHIALTSPLTIGQTSTLMAMGPTGWWAAHMLSMDTGTTIMEPHGTFLLDLGLSSGYVAFAFGPVAIPTPVGIPNLSSLLGLQLHFQDVVVPPANPLGKGAFSNRISATIW